MRTSPRIWGAVEAEVYTVTRGVRPLALLSLRAGAEDRQAALSALTARFCRPRMSGFAGLPVRFAAVEIAPERFGFVCWRVGEEARAAELIALLDGTARKDFRQVGLLLGYSPEVAGVEL